jgi:hypothetical protein
MQQVRPIAMPANGLGTASKATVAVVAQTAGHESQGTTGTADQLAIDRSAP